MEQTLSRENLFVVVQFAIRILSCAAPALGGVALATYFACQSALLGLMFIRRTKQYFRLVLVFRVSNKTIRF